MNYVKESIFKEKFKELPKGLLKILLDTAISININKIFIVGGFVRDSIINTRNKANKMSKGERAATGRKKKAAQKSGKDSGKSSNVANTKKGEVTKAQRKSARQDESLNEEEEFQNVWGKMHWVYHKELNYVEVGEEILEEASY